MFFLALPKMISHSTFINYFLLALFSVFYGLVLCVGDFGFVKKCSLQYIGLISIYVQSIRTAFFLHRVSQFEAQFVDEFHIIIKTVMILLVLDENNNNYSINQEVFCFFLFLMLYKFVNST